MAGCSVTIHPSHSSLRKTKNNVLKIYFFVQREFKGNRDPMRRARPQGILYIIFSCYLLRGSATEVGTGGNEGPVPIARLQTLKIDEKVLATST